jgi:hypothetical protein
MSLISLPIANERDDQQDGARKQAKDRCRPDKSVNPSLIRCLAPDYGAETGTRLLARDNGSLVH